MLSGCCISIPPRRAEADSCCDGATKILQPANESLPCKRFMALLMFNGLSDPASSDTECRFEAGVSGLTGYKEIIRLLRHPVGLDRGNSGG